MVPKEALQGMQLFQGLDDSQLDKLARLCQEETYETGDIIFREGSKASKLYLIDYGKAIVEMGHLTEMETGQGIVGVITTGDSFGWSALVEPHYNTGTVRCLTKVKVITINGEELDRLFDADPKLGLHIFRRLASVIARRLRETRQLLAEERQSLSR
ncbi:MAG: cyclic nucleotide-binding domain-containing protein [Chloroflexi bacterium]|nr:cyclic nucleotide-binding domain-containing protein [Chloroflexota bacterium]